MNFEQLKAADSCPNNKSNAGNTHNYFSDESIHELFKMPGYSRIGTQCGIQSSMIEVKKAEKEVAFMVFANRKNNSERSDRYMSGDKELVVDNKSSSNYLDTKQKGNEKLEKLNTYLETL